jgi:hypothetical protein
MSLALLDVGFIGLTGKSLRDPTLTPRPTCLEDLRDRWEAEPSIAFLTDEDLQYVLVARAEQSALCATQWAVWNRENFGGDSEAG